MIGSPEDMALRAVTGLEGGLVAHGTTCGVVTAGSLGIALMRIHALEAGGEGAARAVMTEVRQYVDWFRDSFSSTSCRDRSRVDFHRMSSWTKYFLPGAGVYSCLRHTGKASAYLRRLSVSPGIAPSAPAGSDSKGAVHCATEVLRRVLQGCGVGDDTLERIAFVLDGGVAFSGGECGAMAGAVMALNLVHGWDIRSMGYGRVLKEFVVGHVNLVRKTPPGRPETFALGKVLVQRLAGTTGSLECAGITGRTFPGWDAFQEHIRSSQRCRALMDQCADLACEAIVRHRTM
jgi:hypothetical protein